MLSGSTIRTRKAAVFAGIALVLVAMLLPVCHLHPLLDQAAPDHCAICVSLHAAPPLAAQVPVLALNSSTGESIAPDKAFVRFSYTPLHRASRAPPLGTC
jgi:hypothetical protein